jgi:molybdopterin molybdotransferase
MRTGLVPASQALEIVLEHAVALGEETVALHEAAGRIVSRDLAALRTQPPFPASAMDGYALRSADTKEFPARLRIAGQSAAGRPHDGSVKPGETVRIFTGGAVPDGADAVEIQENVTVEDGFAIVSREVPHGRYVRPTGLDFTKGDMLLKRGDELTPQRLALAAGMNHPRLPVFRKPVVALIATGDELVMPGEETPPGSIVASNVFGLAAICQAAGAQVRDFGIVADDRAALRKAFEHAVNEADVIVTTGGASVGDHDLVKPVFEEMGAKFEFEKIAMRPGKPFLFGLAGSGPRPVRILGLAGNPVSSLIAASVFVRPLLGMLGGRRPETVRPQPAILARPLPANDEREEYMRARAVRLPSGALSIDPFERQDSSMMALFASANALLVRPANAPPAAAGDSCQAVLLEAM